MGRATDALLIYQYSKSKQDGPTEPAREAEPEEKRTTREGGNGA
jgi:hypothetical protein